MLFFTKKQQNSVKKHLGRAARIAADIRGGRFFTETVDAFPIAFFDILNDLFGQGRDAPMHRELHLVWRSRGIAGLDGGGYY